MKDVWIAGAGIVFGWLMSKTWDDPGCRLGLVLFLVVTAVMVLTFALAVVGHGRKDVPAPEEDDEEG
jgi:ABC-type Fe3+ transport system permease subunit